MSALFVTQRRHEELELTAPATLRVDELNRTDT